MNIYFAFQIQPDMITLDPTEILRVGHSKTSDGDTAAPKVVCKLCYRIFMQSYYLISVLDRASISKASRKLSCFTLMHKNPVQLPLKSWLFLNFGLRAKLVNGNGFGSFLCYIDRSHLSPPPPRILTKAPHADGPWEESTREAKSKLCCCQVN